ncbi:hypothetical protein D6817_01745 [Candidatus Pacearchaeota archaeon]|nr:MAG: hypothetical protein D6817_01745 [Candidatus Pacearchaeota archaeon]
MTEKISARVKDLTNVFSLRLPRELIDYSACRMCYLPLQCSSACVGEKRKYSEEKKKEYASEALL